MQESLMALWPALLSGPHVILHAAGWVEGSLATSIEKMAQDVAALEVFEQLLANEISVDDDALSLGPSARSARAARSSAPRTPLRHVRGPPRGRP
jgi:trimethylamine:corrinoid methyltransferase-like protein